MVELCDFSLKFDPKIGLSTAAGVFSWELNVGNENPPAEVVAVDVAAKTNKNFQLKKTKNKTKQKINKI